MTPTEEYYEKLLADVCRERERYNGMHQIAVMEIDRLRDALAIFLGHDERFQIAVGGNPIAVEKMMESARAVLGRVGAPRDPS
jgi:hypothetical protein